MTTDEPLFPCSRCNVDQPAGEFYASRGGPFGLHAWCKTCSRANSSARGKELRDSNRAAVIEMYGGKCACCGEVEEAFLVLDHVNGGGNADRKASGGNQGLYRRLVKTGKSDEFQLLCCNCNHAKHFRGMCPHQLRG